MIQNGTRRSVPAIPARRYDATGRLPLRGFGDLLRREDDDFEGGRNWALILMFSAMFSAPLLPCIALIAI